MKSISIFLISLLFAAAVSAQSAGLKGQKLPSVNLKTTAGETFSTSEISNDGKPLIISFWAIWCKSCIKELNAIADVYDDWQDETGVKLVAISIDDARSSSQVRPFADGNNWDYKILLDINKDFYRAMNLNFIPHTVILDGEGNIVWQHTSFSEGGELQLIENVRKLIAGGEIDEH